MQEVEYIGMLLAGMVKDPENNTKANKKTLYAGYYCKETIKFNATAFRLPKNAKNWQSYKNS